MQMQKIEENDDHKSLSLLQVNIFCLKEFSTFVFNFFFLDFKIILFSCLF